MMEATDVREIPLVRDDRTLEQSHKDMLSKLHSEFTGSAGQMRQAHVHHPDWVDEIQQWVDGLRGGWINEMTRLHDCALPLVPTDIFGAEIHDLFDPYGDVATILSRMDRQLEAMRSLMYSTMQANGENTMAIGDHLWCHVDTPPRALDYLNYVYEPDENGFLQFKARFNLKDYPADGTDIKASKHGLTVRAKKTVHSETDSYTREYCRTLYIPESVDVEHMHAHLSRDGILTVEAPVISERYKALKLDRNHHLGIKPHAEKLDTASALQPMAKPGLSIIPDGDSGEKLHLEMPVEPDFTAGDISIRVNDKQLIVYGKKEIIEDASNSKCFHVKEFTRSYDLPRTADTLAAIAHLCDNTLLVEAPLLPVASLQ